MGFAFWKGKIELSLQKFSYSPGDTITGDIKLKLKKPIHARKLSVCLVGKEKTRKTTYHDGHAQTSTHVTTICKIDVPVSGEKDYESDSFKFELPVPPDVLDSGKAPDGALGTAVEALDYLAHGRRNLEWSVTANLDIPKGFDVSKTQDIVIK